MIRLVVADDHTSVREGLKRLLAAAADMQVVGEARNGREVIERMRELDPDLLLLDLSMPGEGGVELIKQVHARKPKVRILALSTHEEHHYAVRAIRAGAAGCLHKTSASSTLVEAARKVAAGGTWISAEAARQLALGSVAEAQGPPHAALSDREFQVFRLLGEGKSVRDIAERLQLSVKTVATHKSSVLQKMHLSTQAELIRYAIRERLVDDGSN